MSERPTRDGEDRQPLDSLRENLPILLDSASDQLPGLTRIVAGAWWRSTTFTAGAAARSGRLLARTVTHPASGAELVQEVAQDVAEATRTISVVARRIGSGTPIGRALLEGATPRPSGPGSRAHQTSGQSGPTGSGSPAPAAAYEQRPQDLRDRGARLLQRSRDVWSDEHIHPAFSRILDDLAPDEARILLLLVRSGPQPSVDVRTGGPVGMVSSQLVAPGLNMLGPRAGVRYLDRVPSYVNNLDRLGLVWLAREPVEDPTEYQVLEAQPDVLAAAHSVRFHKVVRRSIHLTPFGEEFCRTCLVHEGEDGDRPSHRAPRDPGN
ncbi:Abi-alpha family protein [Nocardioides donggukensis]|uniref:DUF4393 domain-containing protein n=1 Tax=Nocardioides donggukensis TaxID=2774019 RepID=A0A927K5H6_9ACTN|nr:Abi-alpha family protein [Nocardioides donggukensis]MBD8868226.1 DUF4393 domain-containing protein [Nocardioides donggukensis]